MVKKFRKHFFILAATLFLSEDGGKRMPMRYFLLCMTAVFLFSWPAFAAPKDEAEQLYRSYGDAVYQIQVVNVASGRKTSIGSGFQFSAEGLIATNYHVVAEAIQHPENNRIEFLHDKGGQGRLTVLAADIVHDLAIVKMEKPGSTFLVLGASHLPKGTKVFSLGNPHDIGFTIIEGTYNGLSRESFVSKIHFSGSLNPGMSGGPAIGHDGSVVGVNVATAGNQISFLVPVEPLKKLAGQPAKANFMARAEQRLQEQLLQSQDANMSALLKKKWESVPFGPVMVPGRIHNVLKCWGGAGHKDKDPFKYYFSVCASQDRTFIGDDFDTGMVLYRYDDLTGDDALNLERFYDLYEKKFSAPGTDFENAKEGDVTNFTCNDRFVDQAGLRWKTSFCARQYKKYPKIYDMHLYMAAVGLGKKGFVTTFAAQGVSQDNALKLARRFISEIRPHPAEKGAEP